MRKPVRYFVACCIAGLSLDAGAHDLLSAESVQAYLARVANLQKILGSGSAGEARAEASLHLGQTLDEIRELFNRDVEAHGKVQGLPSSVLMSELTARGAPLAYSARENRFTANLQYYRDALRWAPSGPIAAEASFQLLKGYFYDSVGDDPLLPISQSRAQLAEQIRLGEALEREFPRHAQREEATFILAIHYMQAVCVAAPAAEHTRFLAQARETTARFVRSYPDSLRAATLAVLLDSASAPK